MSLELIVIIVLVIIEGVLYYLYSFSKKRYVLIQNTETSKITTLKKGFYEIKGKVKFLEEKLISPLSHKDCVYYRFLVEEQRSTGKSSSWHTLIKDEKKVSFAVEDSSGQAIIDMQGARLKIRTDDKGGTGIFSDASVGFEDTLARYNISDKAWIFKRTLRYNEKFVEEGDELYVLGEVRDFRSYYPVFSKGKLPYLISDRSEDELIRESKRYSRLALLFLIVLPLAAALFLLYRNSVV